MSSTKKTKGKAQANKTYSQYQNTHQVNTQQKIAPKPKKKVRLTAAGYAYYFFCITLILYVFSSVGLKTYNNYLNYQKIDLEREVDELKVELEIAKKKEIQLSTYDRIKEVANQEGLSETTTVYIKPEQ